MFRSLPRALFISMKDKGRVFQILKNWPERRIKVVCITDGERVGALGDLGVQAVGVPVSKSALYTACGGIPPAVTLPVVIDAGTDNDELLKSPFYVGARHERVRGEAYQELLDEFLTAAKRRFGSGVVIHLEDMQYENMSRIMAQYAGFLPVFADDIQGMAAVVIAGILAARPLTNKQLSQHTIMIAGEGRAATSIAEMITAAMARQSRETTVEARKRLWLVDSHGLVVRSRGDSDTLANHKLSYCHSEPTCPDLLTAVRTIKPSVLIGISSITPTVPFSEAVCREMAANNERPILMPLSQPGAEVGAKEAYEWTDGRCLFADRERRTDSGPVVLSDGRQFCPGTAQTAYIFPGAGLGCLISRCTKLRDEMFIAAAEALARQVTDDDRAAGALYPPMSTIREISANIAKAVAQRAYDLGVATELPRPPDLLESAHQAMYRPQYRHYR
jgi:malate dehydrogenase (oxaloacetate-decarboxylating)(NADP+)